MSNNSRKYLQSTGMLLKSLNEESNNSNYQQQQQQQHQQYHNKMGHQQTSNNSFNQGNYLNMQPYSQSGGSQVFNQAGMFGMGNTNNTPSLNPAAVVAAQFINQIAATSNALSSHMMPDIMMLPGGMSQHRWQPSKHKSNSSGFNKHKPKMHSSESSRSKKQHTSSGSSSVTELPETFGLPSNNSKKYSQESSGKLSPKKSNEDIEIISENYPEKANTTNNNNLNSVNSEVSSASNEETLKSYLAKNYSNKQLAITSKPQSNFISNVACINQLLNECDYYESRKRKPYSTLKLRNIYNENSEEDDDEEDNEAAGDENSQKIKRIKTTHLIVIDDTNEEMHKPWITPDLIKLIKHRNLLQSKIGENNVQSSGDATGPQPDEELLKKFKNLRNKVTKLVKKARKDYLTKYIQESKMTKNNEQQAANGNILEPELANALSKQQPPPPPPATSTTTESSSSKVETTNKSETKTAETTSAVASITSQLQTPETEGFLKNQTGMMMSLYNQYYNQYLQQYQQQQQQAHTLAVAAAAESEKKKKTSGDEPDEATSSSYELLQKQAAYYAQQQAAVQAQLEASLVQASQQLIQEIASMAAAKTQQPFVLNQFNTQQQHHLHQHHHSSANLGSYQSGYQSTSQSGIPLSSSSSVPNLNQSMTNAAQSLIPSAPIVLANQPNMPQLAAVSSQSNLYNMHYNYNMIVS